MEILPFYEKDTGTWSYLLADEEVGEAALIDPVWVYDPVSGRCDDAFALGMIEAAEARGWRIHWVLDTHAHADHVTAADFVRRRCGARVAIGGGIVHIQSLFSRIYDAPLLDSGGVEFDRLLAEGDVVEVGRIEVKVMESPGHTGDSLVFIAGDAAFVGDTLFRPAAGTARCDFPGGDAGQLFDTVQRIHALPDGTRLFLCHDYPPEGAEPTAEVAIEDSRQNNIHINTATTREQFIEVRESRDAGLSLPRLILPALQVNVRGGMPPETGGNGASYLKIPFNTSIAELLDLTQTG
jgi:glyoxylase-like metal-dependent hydrolase (beta-lactamase superfamily II)